MKLLKDCSTKHVYPWLHYTVTDYFNEFVVNNSFQLFEELFFHPSDDPFRKECDLHHNTNDVIDTILNTFLQKENIDFLSSIDSRIKNKKCLLRTALWKDYEGFHLPIHTDRRFKLFTMQIYFPKNKEEGYGTTIYDQKGNFVKKISYQLNNGYFFFPNINNTKTYHSFVDEITTERYSLVFNIVDKEMMLETPKKGFSRIQEKMLMCVEL